MSLKVLPPQPHQNHPHSHVHTVRQLATVVVFALSSGVAPDTVEPGFMGNVTPRRQVNPGSDQVKLLKNFFGSGLLLLRHLIDTSAPTGYSFSECLSILPSLDIFLDMLLSII